MAKTPDINTVTSGHRSAEALNSALDTIKGHFEGFVSRNGDTPNQMAADFDLNGNDLLNVGVTNTEELYVDGVKLTDARSVPNWESEWVTATAYVVNDLIRYDGNVYICLVAHTSGIFSTDLSTSKWELFASKGSAGAGTGDLLAANNLSDVSDAATSRTNLGLGSVAVENTLPVAKGGTGATSASVARTNLGLGTAATTDLIDEDSFATNSATRPPSQQSVKAYVDSKDPLGAPEVTQEFTTWFNTRNTFSHGLGRHPRLVAFHIECVSPVENYSIGDRLPVSHSAYNPSFFGLHSYVTSTEYSVFGFPLTILNKTTNAGYAIDTSLKAANWKLRVELW